MYIQTVSGAIKLINYIKDTDHRRHKSIDIEYKRINIPDQLDDAKVIDMHTGQSQPKKAGRPTKGLYKSMVYRSPYETHLSKDEKEEIEKALLRSLIRSSKTPAWVAWHDDRSRGSADLHIIVPSKTVTGINIDMGHRKHKKIMDDVTDKINEKRDSDGNKRIKTMNEVFGEKHATKRKENFLDMLYKYNVNVENSTPEMISAVCTKLKLTHKIRKNYIAVSNGHTNKADRYYYDAIVEGLERLEKGQKR